MSAPVRVGDKLTDDAPPMLYVPTPGVRIEATYPASDGRCPEAITIVWERPGSPPPSWVSDCVNALAMVPHARTILGHEPR